MRALPWIWIFLVYLSLPALAQQGVVAPGVVEQPGTPAVPSRTDRRITIDVVVTGKSGKPLAGLRESDFTILDNKQPQKVLSFQAIDGAPPGESTAATADSGSEILLLVDEVNLSFQGVALARGQIEKFLRQNGGRLAYPVSMIFLSDSGTMIQNGTTRDGNALAALLDKSDSPLRTMKRDQGFWGALDRRQLALQMLQQITTKEANQPGKKLLIWISPGWSLLAGPEEENTLSTKDRRGMFNSIVWFSTALRQADVTLYSVDPLGGLDIGGFRPFYYKSFLKGVSEPRQVQMGDLALQVLASQSGGLALNTSNDVSGEIEKCVEDANAFYRFSFDAFPAEKPNEYHELQVKVGTPGLKARTRTGYYAQP